MAENAFTGLYQGLREGEAAVRQKQLDLANSIIQQQELKMEQQRLDQSAAQMAFQNMMSQRNYELDTRKQASLEKYQQGTLDAREQSVVAAIARAEGQNDTRRMAAFLQAYGRERAGGATELEALQSARNAMQGAGQASTPAGGSPAAAVSGLGPAQRYQIGRTPAPGNSPMPSPGTAPAASAPGGAGQLPAVAAAIAQKQALTAQETATAGKIAEQKKGLEIANKFMQERAKVEVDLKKAQTQGVILKNNYQKLVNQYAPDKLLQENARLAAQTNELNAQANAASANAQRSREEAGVLAEKIKAIKAHGGEAEYQRYIRTNRATNQADYNKAAMEDGKAFTVKQKALENLEKQDVLVSRLQNEAAKIIAGKPSAYATLPEANTAVDLAKNSWLQAKKVYDQASQNYADTHALMLGLRAMVWTDLRQVKQNGTPGKPIPTPKMPKGGLPGFAPGPKGTNVPPPPAMPRSSRRHKPEDLRSMSTKDLLQRLLQKTH